MLPLTKRQREILDFLNEFIQQHGYAPSLEEIGRKFNPHDDFGNPTGETLYNIRPRSYVIAGHSSEFDTEFGMNEAKVRSFELYRRDKVGGPEIITFDELLQRACFIVNDGAVSVGSVQPARRARPAARKDGRRNFMEGVKKGGIKKPEFHHRDTEARRIQTIRPLWLCASVVKFRSSFRGGTRCP